MAAARGLARIQQLGERFPALPRSILVKTDVLREGVAPTPELEEAGASSLPFFLLWNPAHADNPRARDDQLLMVPWKFDLADGTPVKIVLCGESPYQVRGSAEHGFVLCRDGEEIEAVRFEQRPEWYLSSTSSGRLLPTVIQLFTRTCLFGCILRYCEYSRAHEQCRYCSLDSTVQDFAERGFEYAIAGHPDDWAEGFARALAHGAVRHVSLTGGSLLDRHREARHYCKILSRLNAVRASTGSQTHFEACVSAMEESDQKALRDAGLNVLAHHMDVWSEALWPEVLPGKARHVGRSRWLEALARAVEIFGPGNVHSNLVVGAEVAARGGRVDQERALAEWRECFASLLSTGILPRTTVWQSTPGAAYYGRPKAPTEYYVEVAYERYRLLVEYRAHGRGTPYPCWRCNCWSCDLDFVRLLDGCSCPQCL